MDMKPMSRRMDWLVDKILGDKGLTGKAKHAWLCERLGLFAAMEHYTAVVGEWLLTDPALEDAGMHPTMLDMVKWHGAEEVEHRNVAFDAYMYVDGSYAPPRSHGAARQLHVVRVVHRLDELPLPAGPVEGEGPPVASATDQRHSPRPGPEHEIPDHRDSSVSAAELPSVPDRGHGRSHALPRSLTCRQSFFRKE